MLHGSKRSTINVHNNITQLLDKVLIYLDIITMIQWQIYVRKCNIDCASVIFILLYEAI